MSSTLRRYIDQINKQPKKINLISKILSLLTQESTESHQKIECIEHMIPIFSSYFCKISATKHQATYKALNAYIISFAKILILLTKETNKEVSISSIDLVEKIIEIAPKNIKQQMTSLLMQQVINKQKIQWTSITNSQIIASILKKLNKAIIHENYKSVLNFILSTQHINNINIQNCIIQQCSAQQNIKILKKQYQRVLIQALQALQAAGKNDEKAKLYRKLGQKVFSKLTSPLILAQYFLKKFGIEAQNPETQIQVLSCLFILVGKQGLQMEQFYSTLQKMIAKKRNYNSSLFGQKNSRRFLKLLESAMRSSRVPFQNILSLSKLIIHKIMTEQSQFAFWALAFFVNLVKKHRQLQNHLSEIPQLDLLKMHYSPRIRSLINQLYKNLNKAQYLDIEQFGKVNCQKLCQKKIDEICEKLQSNQYQVQFKIPTSFVPNQLKL